MTVRNTVLQLSILCLAAVFPGRGECALIQAGSLARSDVQAAIDRAGHGDTVVVPPGDSTYSSGLVIAKGITLKGSGRDNCSITLTGGGYLFLVYGGHGEKVRISGFSLDGNGSSTGVRIAEDTKSFRVDGNRFEDCGARAIEINGYSYGLIDNNIFSENTGTDIVVFGDDADAWERPVTLGGIEAVYVEDNTFEHITVSGATHSIASNHGSRYVFRYNSINDGSQNTSPVDAHGNFYYGRGSVSYEIYGNRISSGHSYQGMYIRGGTGVIFDNTYAGDFTFPLILTNYRSWQDEICTYPCIDQINDLHIWDNYYGPEEVRAYIHDRGMDREHIQENRDFFYAEKAGYTPLPYPHPLAVDAPIPGPPVFTSGPSGR